jgi:5,10-methylenetetrahydrofolate reductase
MRLKSKLDEGKFAILAAMEPPKGVDVSTMVANATRVKERVDAFVVPDMNDAVLRMSSLGGALILKEKGMEPVMQLSCRDRNRLALQVPGALIERLQNARDRVHLEPTSRFRHGCEGSVCMSPGFARATRK